MKYLLFFISSLAAGLLTWYIVSMLDKPKTATDKPCGCKSPTLFNDNFLNDNAQK